uniref:Uncharacterized protein n=1 Tax=Hyaloperonospora arabidopsidis (strain Emoy2) TaxID=559515 RepID=M4C485_HYAAE
MAKKKSKKVLSNTGSISGKKEASRCGNVDRLMKIRRLFTAMLEKGTTWYSREREGIVRIEGFQSALLALRDAQAVAQDGKEEKGTSVLAELAGNVGMDPWLAEDLYQQVLELSGGFEELLAEMYALQAHARDLVLESCGDDGDNSQVPVEPTALRPVDYFQMMYQELATFEAEYQHIVRFIVHDHLSMLLFCRMTDTVLGVGSPAASHFVRYIHG